MKIKPICIFISLTVTASVYAKAVEEQSCSGHKRSAFSAFELVSPAVVLDHATGLMWEQSDSIFSLSWEEAFVYAESLEVDGYDDWRLPSAGELERIIDYARSLDAPSAVATDLIFSFTVITNKAGQAEVAQYWTSDSAGGQRSKSVCGEFSEHADTIRIYSIVRCVRSNAAVLEPLVGPAVCSTRGE